MNITRVKSFNGTVRVPGDKSISHRGIMLGSLAKGDTEIQGFLMGADCISSIECFKRMGVGIDTYSVDKMTVDGIHPNEEARRKYADILIGKLNELEEQKKAGSVS